MIYTVGHSNRSFAEFLAVLEVHKIQILVDVRSYPNSKRHPQFNQEELRLALENSDIEYHFAGRALGGMRKSELSKSSSRHTAIESEGFRAYAEHMETLLFQKGINQLTNLSSNAALTIMCAEKLPDQCHRFYLSDYLLFQGFEVNHIINETQVREHLLSPLARRESSELVYDCMSTGELDF